MGEKIPPSRRQPIKRQTVKPHSTQLFLMPGTKKVAVCKPGREPSLESKLASTLILRFLASTTMDINLYWIN
uniref:Uncharacterized protein n=1 Tax=Sus scrofa TaxID=9823 RepID=A0A8D2A435_PIG